MQLVIYAPVMLSLVQPIHDALSANLAGKNLCQNGMSSLTVNAQWQCWRGVGCWRGAGCDAILAATAVVTLAQLVL